ncbi:hypothetical protein TRVL_03691 [Trypanosoma vivax]|nr:hypothetical protein TRVL_03691 [Trypanosoma vivax]
MPLPIMLTSLSHPDSSTSSHTNPTRCPFRFYEWFPSHATKKVFANSSWKTPFLGTFGRYTKDPVLAKPLPWLVVSRTRPSQNASMVSFFSRRQKQNHANARRLPMTRTLTTEFSKTAAFLQQDARNQEEA